MVAVRFVRTGAENGGRNSRRRWSEGPSGRPPTVAARAASPMSDPAMIRQFEANDGSDGIARPCSLSLSSVVAIAVAAYGTGAGSDGGEGGAGISGDDRRHRIGDPAAETAEPKAQAQAGCAGVRGLAAWRDMASRATAPSTVQRLSLTSPRASNATPMGAPAALPGSSR